jgi:hypothetical protein
MKIIKNFDSFINENTNVFKNPYYKWDDLGKMLKELIKTFGLIKINEDYLLKSDENDKDHFNLAKSLTDKRGYLIYKGDQELTLMFEFDKEILLFIKNKYPSLEKVFRLYDRDDGIYFSMYNRVGTIYGEYDKIKKTNAVLAKNTEYWNFRDSTSISNGYYTDIDKFKSFIDSIYTYALLLDPKEWNPTEEDIHSGINKFNEN